MVKLFLKKLITPHAGEDVEKLDQAYTTGKI